MSEEISVANGKETEISTNNVGDGIENKSIINQKSVNTENKGDDGEEVEKAENGSHADELSDLEKDIIRQIEYYFGDINLPKDNFLKEQIQIDDGWVPYSTMLKFKRLAALSTDTGVITAALAKSKMQLMEVSEDGEKIRRSLAFPLPELNEERRKELMTRTIYAKGFPKETMTLDDCLKFFQTYNAENIVMRRYVDKATKKRNFKGSVFVTFKAKEDAEKFLSESSMPYKGVELLRMWQSKYLELKQAEFEERSKKAEKKKNANKQKEEKETGICLPRKSVLILKDVPENMKREEIKEEIKKLGGEVGFIEMTEGSAWVRLNKEETAKEIYDKFTEGILKVNDVELHAEIPDEEAENKFLTKMEEELVKRKQKMSRPKGGNRKRKGGGGNGPSAKRKF